MNGLFPQRGLVYHLVLVAEQLGATQPNFTSTAAALAPVVGVMAEHLLGIGAWGTSASNATLMMSYPVRW